MNIEVDKIRLADEHPGYDGEPRWRRKASVMPRFRETIHVTNGGGNGEYILYLGALELFKARAENRGTVDCELIDDQNEEERDCLLLAERFLCGSNSSLDLGRRFLAYRKQYDINQLTLSTRLDVTAGTIHHYESLAKSLDKGLAAKVEEGKLNFKEARSIADITDHARQRALAKPFMNGSLSSVYVESLIKLAKKEQDTPVEELIRRVVSAEDKERSTTSVATNLGSGQGAVNIVTEETLENALLRIAGRLAELAVSDVSEVRRLRLISGLRILDSRLKAALASLNRYSSPEYYPAPKTARERGGKAVKIG